MNYQPSLADIPDIPKDKLPITEIFYSIQGEGRHAGHPALFIRLTYCNLGCSWCDTRFTWDNEIIEKPEILTNDEIIEKIKKTINPEKHDYRNIRVVITGGEPMLHQDKLPTLLDKLRINGFNIFDIETNGMFVPPKNLIEKVSWWNCSPKLSNNKISSKSTIIPDALKSISQTGKADFKFVVQKSEDIDEIKISFLDYIQADQIMLMAEGWTQAQQLIGMKWLMTECQKRGFRFSPRLHILIWNNERGK